MIIIAGPCVVDEEFSTLDLARALKHYTDKYEGVEFIFKASFDKANRTSHHSFRGPGMKRGLEILAEVKNALGVRITTDVHSAAQCFMKDFQDVVDVVQIPAMLSRQTDLLQAAASTRKQVNIKKSQMMSGLDVQQALRKLRQEDNAPFPPMITERGTMFGYNDLVVDFRNLLMIPSGVLSIFDMSHSIQRPGAGGTVSDGDISFAASLMRAALATGHVDGIFMEVHTNPKRAKCDGPTSIALSDVPELLEQAVRIQEAADACKIQS